MPNPPIKKSGRKFGKNISLFDLKRPISKEELAEWMGVTTRFVDQQVERGYLRKRHTGKAACFLAEDIREWFDRRGSDAKEAK